MPSSRATETYRELPTSVRGSTARETAENEDALDTALRMRPVHEGTIHAKLRHLGPARPMVFVDDFPPQD